MSVTIEMPASWAPSARRILGSDDGPTLRERVCVTGADPDEKFEPVIGAGDYWDAPDLDVIVNTLVDACGELIGARNARIRVLWKPKASKAGGHTLHAKTQLANGLVAYGLGCDVVMVFSAGAATTYTNWEMEAAVYHELWKVGIEINPKSGEHKLIIRRPEFAGSRDELNRYGKWHRGLRLAETALAQAPLFPEPLDDDEL